MVPSRYPLEKCSREPGPPQPLVRGGQVVVLEEGSPEAMDSVFAILLVR